MPAHGAPLSVAFLGCGHAARLHSRTLKALGGTVERCYASRNLQRARDFSRRWGGIAAFGSYQEALEDPRVDVALVLTPPASHLELVTRALRAGKDVIVEKPPFLNTRDFDTARQLCGETERRLFVAENYFYKPLAVRLRKLLADGIIGEPLFFQVNALKLQRTGDWRDDAELAGGGALFEGGIHWISLLGSLGPRVRKVRAIRAGDGSELERSMLVTLDFEGAAAGSLLYSWEVPSPLKGLRISRIYGREGSIAFETNGLFLLVYGKKKRIILPGLRDIAGYRSMFADFLRAIRTGREPLMTLERARRDLELVEAAYASAGVTGHGAASTATAENDNS